MKNKQEEIFLRNNNRAGAVAQAIKHLPSNFKALNLIKRSKNYQELWRKKS
jgi:hypothetical protein